MRRTSTFFFLVFAVGMFGCGQSGSGGSNPPPHPSSPQRSAARPETDIISDDASGVASEPELTRNFYFILDGSGSMDDRCSGTKKIDGLKKAVQEFMTSVPADVNIGALAFDASGVREVVPLGPNNHEKFLNAVLTMQADGGTPLGESIGAGAVKLASQLKRQQGYGEVRLIVVTDGRASDDLDTGVAQAQTLGIPIYTIGFCMNGRHQLAQSGKYIDAGSTSELRLALAETVAEVEDFQATEFDKKTLDIVNN